MQQTMNFVFSLFHSKQTFIQKLCSPCNIFLQFDEQIFIEEIKIDSEKDVEEDEFRI